VALRVLDLNNNYSPTGGGVKTYHDRKLAYYAQRTDVVAALAVPSDHDGVQSLDGGNRLFHVKSPQLAGSGYRLIVSTKRVRRLIEDFKPDVIEVGSVWVMPRLVRRANKDRGIPVVGFYHTDVPHTHVEVALKRFGPRVTSPAVSAGYRWMGRVFGSMTAAFGASEYSLSHLADNGVTRLFHTPFGTDTETFHPQRRSEGLRAELGARDKLLVLYASRINTEKGIDLLMQAYPHFRDPAAIQLVIGGHGPGETRLQPFLEKYPEVQRLPYLSDKADVARAFASADVYLSLGAAETFGLAVPEAMACATPVIAPAAGGAGEQVDRCPEGATFVPGDAHGLARLVSEARPLSGARRDALRDWVRTHYDWDRCFDRMTDFYIHIVDASRAGDLTRLEGAGRWFAG
jgi:alpha-1,6-mannosyltransferase